VLHPDEKVKRIVFRMTHRFGCEARLVDFIFFTTYFESSASVVELADTQDLGSCALWREGSSPSARTIISHGESSPDIVIRTVGEK
jgi:hypothetical protein